MDDTIESLRAELAAEKEARQMAEHQFKERCRQAQEDDDEATVVLLKVVEERDRLRAELTAERAAHSKTKLEWANRTLDLGAQCTRLEIKLSAEQEARQKADTKWKTCLDGLNQVRAIADHNIARADAAEAIAAEWNDAHEKLSALFVEERQKETRGTWKMAEAHAALLADRDHLRKLCAEASTVIVIIATTLAGLADKDDMAPATRDLVARLNTVST